MGIPTFRDVPVAADVEAVRRITSGTGFFRPDEVDVAVELIQERLAKGLDSGYHFWFADSGSKTVGYVCYGPIPCTIDSFDLYWIVVDREGQGHGLGGELAALTERSAKAMGGRRIYVETAGKALYLPTRTFYEKIGYFQAAELPDFYEPGDSKIVYQKNL